MKNKIKNTITVCLILLSATLWAQDISNLEKSILESKVKQLVINEVSINPFFKEVQISNSNPVKFRKFTSDDYSHITNKEDQYYGRKKGDYLMQVTFYKNNEDYILIDAIILLKTSEIRAIHRGIDNMGITGNLIMNKK